MSKAVRIPAEIEINGRIVTASIPLAPPPTPPVEATITGNPDQQAEILLAYEAGYRAQPLDSLSIDIAAFFNDYDRLDSYEAGETPLSTRFGNSLEASAAGFETAVEWNVIDWWKLQASYSYLYLDTGPDRSGRNGGNIAAIEGQSPEHQYSLRSSMDLGSRWKIDVWAYGASALKGFASNPDLDTDGYTSLNLRIARQLGHRLRFALLGHDLLESRQLQFIGDLTVPTAIERSIHAELVWGW